MFFVAFLLSVTVAHGAHARGIEVSFKKCLACHPDIQKEMAQKGAHAPFKQFQCSGCHNPHASNYKHLVKDEISIVCKSCHKDKKGAFEKNYGHKPFEDGECLKCHNPHSSKNAGLLVAKGEQLCFGCHSNKELLSRKNKHGPVKKGNCLTCHGPHTSDHEGLLKKCLKEICASCHSTENKKTEKSHLYYSVQGTRCTSCHNPHGSDGRHLIRQSSHKPFAKRECTVCHNEPRAKNPLGTKGSGASICFACHPSSRQDFKKINSHVQEGVFCVNCHSPHASDESHMKKAKEVKICFRCHEDTKEYSKDKKNQHKHPLIKEGKCSPCHRRHGSDFRLFFGTDEFALCTHCHKRHANFTHPIGEEAVDPRSKRNITCITCHNLMGSPHDFSLRLDRKKQLCIQCHKGY